MQLSIRKGLRQGVSYVAEGKHGDHSIYCSSEFFFAITNIVVM